MERRSLLLGAVLAVLVMAAIVSLRRERERSRAWPRMPAETTTSTTQPPTSSPSAVAAYDGGAIAQTVADRRVRDELRRRILAGWAQGADDTQPAAKEAPMPRMPTGPDGKIDPQYIKDVVRSDLKPMVAKCYEELRARKPGAEGRISLTFRIIGDDKLGAIVDETKVGDDAGALAEDERFTTCVTESTMSLAFRPLPHSGSAVVPLTFVFEDHD